MRRVAVLEVLALLIGARSGVESSPTTPATSTLPQLSVTTTVSASSTTTSLVAATTSTMTTGSPDAAPTSITTTTATTVPADVIPPVLVVTDPDSDVTVTTSTYVIKGTVEPDCHLVAAGRYPVDVDPDGAWAIQLVLRPGRNTASFQATDPAGNISEANVRITYGPPIFDTSDWVGRTVGTAGGEINGSERVTVDGEVRDDLLAQVGAVAPWDAEYSRVAYAWFVSIVPAGTVEPPAHGRVMVWLVEEPTGGMILDALGLITSPGNELEYCWQVHSGGAAWPLVIWVGGYAWSASPPPEHFSSFDLAQLECSAR